MHPPIRASALQAERPESSAANNPTVAFYDLNAVDYARATRSISLEKEVGRFCTLLWPGARVLDIGCGGGRDLLALRNSGIRPTGLELSVRLAEIARHYSDCEVVVGDMRHPPFEAASFDGIWAAASLLHLECDEVLPTLHRLRRLLGTGGAFFASVKMGLGSERTTDGRLFSYFLPEEWSALLASAGFTDIEIQTEMRSPTTRRGAAWIQSLSRAG